MTALAVALLLATVAVGAAFSSREVGP